MDLAESIVSTLLLFTSACKRKVWGISPVHVGPMQAIQFTDDLFKQILSQKSPRQASLPVTTTGVESSPTLSVQSSTDRNCRSWPHIQTLSQNGCTQLTLQLENKKRPILKNSIPCQIKTNFSYKSRSWCAARGEHRQEECQACFAVRQASWACSHCTRRGILVWQGMQQCKLLYCMPRE